MVEPILVDPEVSRRKFERELAGYRKLEGEFTRQGWWVLRAEYPEVFVVFAAPQVKPPSVVFGAILDFTNYDLWPPSVRLADPFTRIPYRAKELPTQLFRKIPAVIQEGSPPAVQAPNVQAIMQAHDPEDVPFLCLPGVREYHDHPAHSGDSWLIHRKGGEGTLYFLLDQLYKYGVRPITGYQANIQININGYLVGVPE